MVVLYPPLEADPLRIVTSYTVEIVSSTSSPAQQQRLEDILGLHYEEVQVVQTGSSAISYTEKRM